MENQLERLKAALAHTYTVERELGAGGMAIVYLARDVKHDRQVAIKVLHADLSATIGAERFEREIKLAAKLQHPHILGLYDSGEADGLLYYVMPFVEGESLRDRLDREGQLPLDDAIQLILEVADALGYAHKQGIVHRDIKPENVLLSGGHALVADFGIARAAEEGGAAKLTQTGMAMGTPVYMAPEQAVGEKVGPAADIYSLGCMLFEMLAGEPPFSGKNAVQIMARHAMEQVPSIRIVRQSVPEEVEEAIFAAMGKSPADRPKTCAEFTEILGMPLGATATLRVMGRTSTRRAPSGSTRLYQVAEAPVPIWRRGWAIGLAAVLVAGGAFAAWRVANGGSGAATPVGGGLDVRRIAVLYFDDASPGGALGYLADGLTEGLIQSLNQVQGLSVISRTGVAPFRGSTLTPDSIARTLSAGTLVRGTVEPLGDRVRVSVRLLDGTSGVDLGERASFERSSQDLLGARDSLAVEVARLVRTRLGQEVRLREQRSSTRNNEAWLLVQQAEQLRKSGEAASARSDTTALRSAFSRADSLLSAAEALDARWAEPPLLRGFIAYRWSRLVQDRVLIARHIGEGVAHVERALAIDAGNPDALELRGNLNYWFFLMQLEPDAGRANTLLARAKADLEAATNANPNQAGAWATLSHLYNRTGTGVDVNLAARRALEADAFLDNASVIMSRLFLSSYDLGQFPEADHWCQETRRRFPADLAAPRCELFLMTTRTREPDAARAWRLADSVVAMAPGPRRRFFELNSHLLVAAVLGRAGQADSARRVTARSVGDEEVSPTRDLSLVAGFAYLQAGDTTRAVEQLQVYFGANPPMRAAYAQEPGWWFRGLSIDPRWRRLVGGP